MHRKIIQEIVSALPPSEGYDWAWCALLRRNSKRILVSKESYFQHIGLQGSHCNGIIKEFGLNFNPVHDINKIIIHEYFQEASELRKQYIQALILQRSKKP